MEIHEYREHTIKNKNGGIMDQSVEQEILSFVPLLQEPAGSIQRILAINLLKQAAKAFLKIMVSFSLSRKFMAKDSIGIVNFIGGKKEK